MMQPQPSGAPGPWPGPGNPPQQNRAPHPIQPAPVRRPGASAPSAPTEPPSQPIAPTAGRDVDPRRPMFRPFALPVSTTGDLPGARIERIVGVVFGVVTRPRDLAHNPEMAFVNTSVRQDAVAEMVEQARRAGADAVVGLAFHGGRISEGVSEVTAYGTAVTLARQSS